ncbi:autotransporter assembly complex protein TamA [Flavimaricola marinus]|uniref:autotransporter assembly complex protein TamA n=1 Tax=Flavimaricola marinus TaxID=1819565 RepID=UPI001FE74E8F|nr:BamA/TamA family outer membrane protein [Flavimaricola marinus]
MAAGSASAQQATLVLPPEREGLRDTLTEASLTLALGGEEPGSAQDYVAAARADYRRLLTGLYAEGFYSGTISITVDGREASGLAPLDAPNTVNSVVITVNPGPRFNFGTASISPTTPSTELPEGFATGRVARTPVIREAVNAAVNAWQEDGHAKATPAGQQITAIHPEERLDVTVQIAPGPRLSFGELTIEGNEDVRTARIREIAGLPVGEVYSPAELERSANRLRRTGTFQSVAYVESDSIGPNDTLPFTLQVVEQIPRRIGAGAELSSSEGLTVSAYWLHRNLLGGAERFRIDAEISDINTTDDGFGDNGTDYSVLLSFGRPSTFRSNADLSVTAEISRDDEPDYLLDSAEIEASLIKYVRDDLTYQMGLGLLTAREETSFRERSYTLLTLPLQGTLERRNDPLDATSGYFLDLELTPFLTITGGENGARLYADGRIYQSFGEDDRLTLAARGQFGSVVGADILQAPADYLFYAGGGGTVRGQAFQALAIDSVADFGTGPTDVRTGGASFLGGQFEARVKITDQIGAVGFYDIAVVGAEAFPMDGDDWIAGAGIGLRYDTGIGPIRLDLATPTTGDSAGERLEVYIGIGQSF